MLQWMYHFNPEPKPADPKAPATLEGIALERAVEGRCPECGELGSLDWLGGARCSTHGVYALRIVKRGAPAVPAATEAESAPPDGAPPAPSTASLEGLADQALSLAPN